MYVCMQLFYGILQRLSIPSLQQSLSSQPLPKPVPSLVKKEGEHCIKIPGSAGPAVGTWQWIPTQGYMIRQRRFVSCVESRPARGSWPQFKTSVLLVWRLSHWASCPVLGKMCKCLKTQLELAGWILKKLTKSKDSDCWWHLYCQCNQSGLWINRKWYTVQSRLGIIFERILIPRSCCLQNMFHVACTLL
jgi:hypothetical protein